MSLASDLKKITSMLKADIGNIYRLSVNDVGNQIITISAVDEGTFKANWLSSIGVPNLTFDTSKTNSSESKRLLDSESQKINSSNVFYFTNPSPYAQKLEDGHSLQAKNGMVKISVNDFPQIFDARVNSLKR